MTIYTINFSIFHFVVHMSNLVPNKVILREVLLHSYTKKSAAESHQILVEVYGDHALAEQTCKK